MRLYYMTGHNWAEKIIREQRFKLSKFDGLNDPFELLCIPLGNKIHRKLFRGFKEHICQNYGVICTSKTWTNPVMWAHYGVRHTGICLGFDLSKSAEAVEVSYHPERMAALLEKILAHQGTEDDVKKIVTTKFEDWKYEREWRILGSLKEADPSDGNFYLNFNPDIKLREVILGANCAITAQEIAKKIKSPTEQVKVFKVRPAFDTFSMTLQKNVAAITVMPRMKK